MWVAVQDLIQGGCKSIYHMLETRNWTGHHFNEPGHTIANMQMTILELCHTKDPMVLGVREQHYIKLFNAYRRGINRNSG